MANSPNLIQVSNGKKSFGPQLIFDDVTFTINENEHVGVIGPNGAGKSTLFKILIDEDSLDDGLVIRSGNLRLGYLSQHDHWGENETGDEYLERVCKLPVWEAKALGQDLKIPDEIFEKRIMSLSGGYRMRIKLVGLLGTDPNLMLLDEPTNYLDLETTILLETFLQNYEGAFLLISHDREVLRRTTDHTLEVESGDIVKYNGNIDDYFEQKELLRSQLQAQAQSQALKRKAVLDFVSKFGAKASKARQAQSRLKQLEKMEVIEFKAVPVTSVIKIPEPEHSGKTVLRLINAEFGYPEKTVLKNVNMDIMRGDHVAVIGLNGAGKSTLLKGIAGTLAPLKGKRELGYEARIAIYNQHVVEILNPNHTVIESLEEIGKETSTPQDIRAMAGSLLFNKEAIHKKVSVLSGGEKSRLALGRILLQKVSCLLFDEPTNHLDFQTVETLIQALNKYKGTVIVVSHDRGFIRRVSTKILEVSKGQVNVYPGTYDEYVWSLQKRLASEDVTDHEGSFEADEDEEEMPAVSDKDLKIAREKELRVIEKKLDACQKEMERLEKETAELNQRIVDGDPHATFLAQQMATNTNRTHELEIEWMRLDREKEKLQN